MINLIERLAAAKDQFPAGSPHRIAIWDAIEALRNPQAPLCEECGIELGERIGALVVMRD